jgi:GNAT superfamily N-acetyltransferase
VIVERSPGDDAALAARLWQLQRAAYAVEAALIGDDRIPTLHERLDELAARPLEWAVVEEGDRVLGAVAWQETAGALDIDRLVVDPAVHRRGLGRALVGWVVDRAAGRDVVVSTGRDNVPARTLYERAGFVPAGECEVLPGLWVAGYRLPGDRPTRPAA